MNKPINKNKFFLFFAILCFCFMGLPDAVLQKGYEIQKKTIEGKVFHLFGDTINCRTGSFCDLYYTENTAEYADMIIRITDTYYPVIMKDFGDDSYKKAQIVLYGEKETFAKALNQQNDILPMGAYYGGMVHILTPGLWTKEENDWRITEDFIENGPLIHELVHLAMDEKAKGEYPLWFTEGVALYYENKYTGFEWRNDLEKTSKIISRDMLEKRFRYIDTGMAYRRSYDFVRRIVDCFGEKELQRLILNEKALSDVMDDLEKSKMLQ